MIRVFVDHHEIDSAEELYRSVCVCSCLFFKMYFVSDMYYSTTNQNIYLYIYIYTCSNLLHIYIQLSSSSWTFLFLFFLLLFSESHSDMKALGYESNVWIVTSLIIGHGRNQNQTTNSMNSRNSRNSIKRATELFDEFINIEKRKDDYKKEDYKKEENDGTQKNEKIKRNDSRLIKNKSMTSLYNSLLFAYMNNQTDEEEEEEEEEKENDEKDEREKDERDEQTMVDRSLALLQQMKMAGVTPDVLTHSIIVKGLCYASKKFDKKDGRLKKYTRIA